MVSYKDKPLQTREIALKQILAFLRCRKGATAIEYGLIAGGVSLVIVAAVFGCGDSINGLYDSWSSYIGPLISGG
jgi:pilus assembly protein Flp/PilA